MSADRPELSDVDLQLTAKTKTVSAPSPCRIMRSKRASEVKPQRIVWLWPGWLPAGRLALLGGRPGDGKSSVTIDLAARLSTGSPLPDGYRPPAPLTVLILSGEDDPADTIVPRLLAAGANLERVVIANGTVVDTETGIARPWILPADVPELANLVHENAVDLCVIDPLAAFVATAVDTHRDAAVRSMLLPLSTMARHEKCAVIGVRHHRKGGALDARDAGTGSVAFTAAARIEWVAGRDPEDPGRRVLAVAKTNIAAVPPSRLYRLVAAEGEFDTVAVRWEGTSTVTANELASGPVSAEERSELDEAVEFLREVLAAGPVEANVVKRQAHAADIAERTMRRAKERLRVKARKAGSGPWTWHLPGEGGQGSDEARVQSEHGRLGPLGHLPCSESYIDGGFSRARVKGGQDVQGGQWRTDGHLPGIDAPDLDDDDLDRLGALEDDEPPDEPDRQAHDDGRLDDEALDPKSAAATGAFGAHRRWHEIGGRVNEKCLYCRPVLERRVKR
ncbi:MAG: AAA family ATPase [Acidimicrobiales bacterium]